MLFKLCGIVEEREVPSSTCLSPEGLCTVVLRNDIDSFEKLRSRHDIFVSSFINDLKLVMSKYVCFSLYYHLHQI